MLRRSNLTKIEIASFLKIPGMKNIIFLVVLMIGGIGRTEAQMPYYMQADFRNANNNWIFGRMPPPSGSPGAVMEDSAQHIDFNTTPPTVSRKLVWTPLTRPGHALATVAVSDRDSGKLLFYTEGLHVYNRKQEVMPNGSGLKGDDHIIYGQYYQLAMRQGFCAVPVFRNRDQYYLFNLTHTGTNITPAPSKLYYNIIDMSLDGGTGDVLHKNVPLDTLQQTMFGDPMAAIPGDNCDVWVLLYDRGVMGYKAFHITDQGIDPTPVISPSITGLSITDMLQGRLAFSSDRHMVAMAYNYNAAIGGFPHRGCVLARFDPATGIVSNEILVETDEGGSAVAFSPDDSKLYLSSRTPIRGQLRQWQYEIADYNTSSIRQSRYLILDSFSGIYDDIRRRDDKLIVADAHGRVGVIMQPDMKGTACDFRSSYFSVAGIQTKDSLIVTMHLGNDVILPLPPATFQSKAMDTLICRVDRDTGMLLEAAPGGIDYLWDDGQTGATRTIAGEGTYWVRYDKGCNTYIDTFTIKESSFPPPVIMVDANRLYTRDDYNLYQWFRNDTVIGNANRFEFIAEYNADYHVVVQQPDGCMERSATYTVNNLSVTDVGEDVISVYPNPVSDIAYIRSSGEIGWQLHTVDGRLVLEQTGAKTVPMHVLPQGLYILEVYSMDNSYPLKRVMLVKE